MTAYLPGNILKMRGSSHWLRNLEPFAVKPHCRAFVRCSHSTSPSRNPTIASLFASSHTSGQQDDISVTIDGFVQSVRKQKNVAFAVVGDGTTIQSLQAVLAPTQAEGLATGIGVRMTGIWKRSPSGAKQKHELHVEELKILGGTDASTYPLQKKYHTDEYLRTIPHLRSRTPFNSLLLRLRSHSVARLTKFFSEREFVQTHPPVITSSDCEGAGEVFTVATGVPEPLDVSNVSAAKSVDDTGKQPNHDFFRTPKYLTVSSQLHLEALAQSVGRVWSLSPTFRAERSDTARHLSEFYMLEAELSFINSLEPLMSLVEDIIQDLVRGLEESPICQELFSVRRTGENEVDDHAMVTEDRLRYRWLGLRKSHWPRVTYTQALDRLREAAKTNEVAFQTPPSWNAGLQTEHERFLAEDFGKGSPVFITDYPQHLKAFYMLPSLVKTTMTEAKSAPGPTVACFDLLMPEVCEVAGGSLREHRLPELLQSMRSRGLIKPRQPSEPKVGDIPLPMLDVIHPDDDLGNLEWYVDLRRWSTVPHGGFGLGFDRLLAYLSGVENIREIVAFPRWVGRCDC